jgi:AcrR family transcriptional regulator
VTPRTQTPGRLTRVQKREANRDRILRAARAVFGARGYHAATIEEIAGEAGLSNGAIYYNFDSKEALFLALLDERTEERLEHVRRTFAGGEVGVVEEARDVTRSFKESREWRLLLLEFVAYAARNPDFAEAFTDHKRKLRAALAEALEAYMSAQAIAPAMEPAQLALVITGLANGLAIEELADPGAVSDELLGDAMALLARPG